MPLLPKKFLKEVNSPLQKLLNDNQQKKSLIFLAKKFNCFCYKRSFQKGWCVTNRIFARFKHFICQKSLTNAICGKYLDEVYGLAFMSSSGKKNIFQKVLPNLVEKTKQWYVLPKYNKMK